MTFLQRNQALAVLVVSFFLGDVIAGCSKPASAPSPTTTKPTDGKGEAGEEGGEEGGETAGGDDACLTEDCPPVNESFDLCTGLMEKKSEIDGFDEYIDELCGTGENQNKLPTLRKSENVFKGGEPKLLKKTDNGDGSTVAVRLFTSTIVDAKATDYFALIRLQVSKPDKFAENYEHDEIIKLSEVDAKSASSSFKYEYEDGEGRVAYKATARFYTLEKSTAYVSATKMDSSIETMKDFRGLIIVNQKGDKTEVFTMSDQKYEVANGQDPKLYDSRATEKAGKEQKRMYNNADKANEAPGLLK